jgi:hypothetical protein
LHRRAEDELERLQAIEAAALALGPHAPVTVYVASADEDTCCYCDGRVDFTADEFEGRGARWMPYTADEVTRLEALFRKAEREGIVLPGRAEDTEMEERLIATLRMTESTLSNVRADLRAAQGRAAEMQTQLTVKKRRVLVKALRRVLRDYGIEDHEIYPH